MSYTWEETMLNLDVRDEAKRERKQQEAISDKQLAEAEATAGWSLAGTVLCGAIWGPAGIFVCNQIAKYGIDAMYEWEDMAVDEGKFSKEEAREFKKTRKREADAQTSGQRLGTAIDLATMFVSGGGLKEGLGADFTTFGAGGAGGGEWSVFGKGEAALPAIQTSAIGPSEFGNVADIMPEVPASADYVPSLWEGLKNKESRKQAMSVFSTSPLSSKLGETLASVQNRKSS